MTKPLIVLAVSAGIAAAGCGGQSSEEKAQSQVCSARADISKQVDTLSNLTPSTATIDQIRSSVSAIMTNLRKIGDAQGGLKGDRRQELQAANKEFTSQVSSIAGSLLQSTSLSDAENQLKSAGQQLAATYKSTLAKVDC